MKAFCHQALAQIQSSAHGKTNEICAQHSRQPPSLIKVFAVRLVQLQFHSHLWSAQCFFPTDWVDAQANLSFRWIYR